MAIGRRDFLIGAAAAGLSPLAALAQAARTPFTDIDGKLRAQASVNGVSLDAVLDSGGAFDAIDAPSALALGLPPSGARIAIQGMGGAVRGRMSAPVALTLAGRTLEPSALAVVDLSSQENGIGRSVDLILGAPLFMDHAVDFDFITSTFGLLETGVALPGRQTLALTPNSPWMTAPVTLAGGVVQATVDIGSESPLILSPSMARRLKIPGDATSTTSVMGGVGGTSVGRVTSVASITFAGVEFSDVPVQIAAREFGTEANIGLGILSRFDLCLDFGAKRLLLARNAKAGPFARNLVGFYGAPDDQAIRVSHVARNSPAATAGLKRGDVIATINGETATIANPRLTGAQAGSVLRLTLRNGQTREVTLGRYY